MDRWARLFKWNSFSFALMISVNERKLHFLTCWGWNCLVRVPIFFQFTKFNFSLNLSLYGWISSVRMFYIFFVRIVFWGSLFTLNQSIYCLQHSKECLPVFYCVFYSELSVKPLFIFHTFRYCSSCIVWELTWV